MAARYPVTVFAWDLNRDGLVNWRDVPEWCVWVVMYPGQKVVHDLDAIRPGNWLFTFFELHNPVIPQLMISIAFYYCLWMLLRFIFSRRAWSSFFSGVRGGARRLHTKPGANKNRVVFPSRGAGAPLSQAPSISTAQNLLRNGQPAKAAEMFLALKDAASAIDAYKLAAEQDKRYFLDVAEICFTREENFEGLKACLSSGDLEAIAFACRRMGSWEHLIDFMLNNEQKSEQMARLDEAFWQDCLLKISIDEKTCIWLAQCTMLTGSVNLAELILERLQEAPDFCGRYWSTLEARTLNDVVTNLLAQGTQKRYPPGFLSRSAHGLFMSKMYSHAALMYECDGRFAIAGKCFVLSGDLAKGAELLLLGKEPDMAARVNEVIAGLPTGTDAHCVQNLPKEVEYSFVTLLAPLDPTIDSSHAASPFRLTVR